MKSKIQPGMRFGSLIIKERDYSKKTKNAYWICQCDCGNIVSKAAQGLNNGGTVCCDRYKCPNRKKLGTDLTNQKFGRLTALYPTEKRINNSIVWLCKCDCGNTKEVSAVLLTTGGTKSCGCLKQEKDKSPKGNVKDEVGNKYGHLTVIARAGSNNNGQALWECQCDCGNPNTIIVLGNNLRRGHTLSCGCDRRSHGEIKLSQILDENDISYIQEYKAFKFSSGAWARFDFYINNQYIIEYDGETHYQYSGHGWHNEEHLRKTQERDIIKNQWCKDNNIPLIRIPYWHLQDLCIEDLRLETSKFIIGVEE